MPSTAEQARPPELSAQPVRPADAQVVATTSAPPGSINPAWAGTELAARHSGVASQSPPPSQATTIPEPYIKLLENFFPWPPPPASARTTFSAALLSDKKRFKNVGDVATLLEHALHQGGFDDWSYFSLPDERVGFGLVSRVEQIDPQTGTPLADRARWADRVYAAETMSFMSQLLEIQRPVGHYRAFVFVLSTKPTPDLSPPNLKDEDRATLQLARTWIRRGSRFLPDELQQLPITSSHRITVRVYEFEQTDKGPSSLVANSPWTVSQHLKSAGIQLGE
ncbi:MAG: hypothetical protein C5B58_10250 [Acidobacteria bacterium]|nr:MAG: hypothetical protein C5B58_10250 [Acidobacteriota bacterium]